MLTHRGGDLNAPWGRGRRRGAGTATGAGWHAEGRRRENKEEHRRLPAKGASAP